MLGDHPGDLYRHKTQETVPNETNLHNTAPLDANEEGETSAEPAETAQDAAPGSEEAAPADVDGTWGERDVGGPVSHREAMEDFEAMRRQLSSLSHSKSHTQGPGLARTLTGRTSKSARSARRPQTPHSASHGDDLEAGDAGIAAEKEREFQLAPFLKEGHFEKRTESGDSAKKVGVVFRNLSVKGIGSSIIYAKTLPEAIMNTFGPDLYNLICRFVPALNFKKSPRLRTLINDFTGVVRDGEMMLVLGRPGSGCSTLLKAIANKRAEYASVSGDVSYGGIKAQELESLGLSGEVNYNAEDDQHLPMLNVFQTLFFSLLNKTRKREKGEVNIIVDALMKMFGISHTSSTLVGNEMVRGISGGERKRVSIAETLATKSTVVCWDNSTRGLDASTALDYANSLRIMTDVSDRTTLVTLYQAGEQIYQLMDKVLLIAEGRMLYQGLAKDAKQYFIDLGLHCPERETTADFLTSLTDPLQRQYRAGFEKSAPKTAEDFEKAFKNSASYAKVLDDVATYEQHLRDSNWSDTEQFKQSVQQQRSHRVVSKKSNFTVSYWRQVLACTLREFWLMWGDKTALKTKFFIIISVSLIVSSLFYGMSNDTSGAFPRGGFVFFGLLLLGWLQLGELIKAVSGRPITQRHKEYAFYRPSAVSLARVIADLPMIFAMTVPFVLISYFLGGLDVDVSKFFIFTLFVYSSTIMLTALYRMFASLSPTIDDAVRFSGTAFNVLIIYTGYVITKPQLIHDKIWFGWVYYINPLTYAFEGVISNEFAGRVMACAPSNLVPQGPDIQPQYQGCAITGATAGNPSVTGEQYLAASFDYSRSHLWRNFGVIIAFTVLYILITVVASETFSFVSGGGGALIFKKGAKTPISSSTKSTDEEKAGDAGDDSASSGDLQTSSAEISEKGIANGPKLAEDETIFTWTDVNYSVPTANGERQLLEDVNGYVKPGIMMALMGVSGAGKTTLLNTLSQRQRFGTVSGTLLIDGHPPGPEFQRLTGYVEQMDMHDMTATIREAIEFSAILRQDRTIKHEDKMAYVEEIIDLLELREIQDALIMSLGVERRKRVTIAVELAARPSMLFLDEPTTGLDSQSAFTVIRFLQKLARAGHGIICTIHQPSSILIQQFDTILALNPGGQTIYFGPIGDNGATVNQYFADRQVYCPPEKNIAEFILETAAKGGSKRLNWFQQWSDSQERKDRLAEIVQINEERSKLPRQDVSTTHEYAAPLSQQCYLLTKRMFTQHWRDPSYLYGKLFVAFIVGVINGFTFYDLGNSIADMQNRLFTSFIVLVIPPTVVNGVIPKFFGNMSLWLYREQPSRIYNWFAFCTASVVTEIPISIVSSLIYWLPWYWPTGLPRDSSTAGYSFWMVLLIFLFIASWGQWICAFAPSFTVLSNVLPFFFVMFSLFNGVIRPWEQLSVFWRYWMYYLNPSTYWIGGILAATLRDITVQCAENESAKFNPPPGQTCATYAGDWVAQAGRGYLTNPDATVNCGYCQYKSGEEYLATLNIKTSDKWRNLPIFLAFVISNWALVYFFIYTVRVKHWAFGLGYVSKALELVVGLLEKAVGKLIAPLMKKRSKPKGQAA